MILDVTGTVLIPGVDGKTCPGNGMQPGTECCCDECNYFLCCYETKDKLQCSVCADRDCPNRMPNEI